MRSRLAKSVGECCPSRCRSLSSAPLALWMMVGVLALFGVEAAPALAQETATAERTTTDDASETATEAEPVADDEPQPLDEPEAKVDPGQADLDEAVLKRINADTGTKLQAVATLLESAIAKGLGEENTEFAKQMLGSVQLQLGQGLFGAMMRGAGGNALALRGRALETLKKAVENDDQLVEAHVLIAQLNSPAVFPDADVDLALKSADKAIELYEDDAKKRSAMLVMRAGMQKDPEDQLSDLEKAIEIDPKNQVALDARVAYMFNTGEFDQGIELAKELVAGESINLAVIASATEKLMDGDRNEDALELLTDVIDREENPELLEKLYRIRSQVHGDLGDAQAARQDMDKSIELRPGDPIKLLEMAQFALQDDDLVAAKSYLRDALDFDPRVEQLPKAILVKFLIASEEERITDAINEIESMIKLQEGNDQAQSFWQEQLGRFYMLDERNRKAIEIFESILEKQPENEDVLRLRGDALLAIGQHAEAIRDYEDALKLLETSPTGPAADLESTDQLAESYAGVLNNLAWVLATSPQDAVRDGRRSLELSKEAARLTDFTAAHILSTLAASYAELGDMEKAIEYSQRAVDLGEVNENEQLDQLKLELKSYRSGEPWREKQETEENAAPILNPEDLIDI